MASPVSHLLKYPVKFLAAGIVLWVPVLCAAELYTEVRVFPKEIRLSGADDRQTFVIQGMRADGVTVDLTDVAKVDCADPNLLTRSENAFSPAKNGTSTLTISVDGHTSSLPVECKNSEARRPVSFKLDVMPIFLKTGCNTGSCHGAARGKDGFRLSLFGYDADGDYQRITREILGRRVDFAIPESSLLIEKSIGVAPHTGGKRFDKDSEFCKTISAWIGAGCPEDPKEIPVPTSLSLDPPGGVLETGKSQRLTVKVVYSDGSDRDVTHLAMFSSNNDASAGVSPAGVVSAGQRGEAFVMARFATFTVGSHFVVIPENLKYEANPIVAVNYIDELVSSKLNQLRMEASPRCSDEEYLRRVYIDLIGQLPSEAEFSSFMANPNPGRREQVVEDLLERREFTEVWVSKWAEWLMMRSSNDTNYKGIILYYNWLANQIARNVPLDVMVREMLSATGGTFENPPTNFYQIERDVLKTSENVAQIFMGMRTQCAQCHNHPFDRWTQDDYYSFAAFFSQIGRKVGEDYRETIVFNSGGGDVKHPVTGKVMQPVYLGASGADVKGKPRREVLAEWLASSENPFFARNFANRVWHHFFGIGIVEPVDDVRISNPPSNEPLLAELAKRLTDSGYDFKKLVREICRSETYQRSTQRNATNELDERNFAHQTVRRIKAESMLDILSQVTNTKDKFRGLPQGARAVQIADGAVSSYFLTTFGRATRATACSCEVKMEPTLSQALHLLNGDATNDKIQKGAIVASYLKEKLTPEEIIDRIYIRCLSRKPTETERNELLATVPVEGSPQQALEDIFWAVLNSREFLFNH